MLLSPKDNYTITELIYIVNMITLTEKQWRREVVSVQVKEFFNAQCFEKLSRSFFCNFFSADLTIFGEYEQSETFPLRQRIYFNICNDGKWRHHLIIHHHLRFERFLILHRCYAKLFNDLRLNKTLIITKTFKNAASKPGCFWSGCWFDGTAFVHCVSRHGNGAKNWKQSSL